MPAQRKAEDAARTAEPVERAIAPLEWVRPPRQERSAKTLDRILSAAEELIAEKGYREATISEIVRRARSSVGAFYSRFADKEALLYTLHERFFEESMATADAALDMRRWEGATLAEIIRTIVRFTVSVAAERAGLIKAFTLRGAADPDFALQGAQLGAKLSKRLTMLLEARADEIGHPDVRAAGDFCTRTILALMDQRVMFGEIGPTQCALSEEQLVDEMVRVAVRYLEIRGGDAVLLKN